VIIFPTDLKASLGEACIIKGSSMGKYEAITNDLKDKQIDRPAQQFNILWTNKSKGRKMI
jgi:hypothetical protein